MLSEAARKDPAMSGQLDYARVDGDYYPTPPENVNCLHKFFPLDNFRIWEPACGQGHLSKRLAKFSKGVSSSDLYDRGYGTPGLDFLKTFKLPRIIDWDDPRPAIITNPPYLGDLPEQFIRHALQLTQPRGGAVAMFLRNEYDMSSEDRPDLFEGHSAYHMKICVTKRPRFIEGSKGSPRHNYAWYVWDWRTENTAPVIHYIHPSQVSEL